MEHTIQITISEAAYKKLRTQSTVKQLMGSDHMGLADIFLARVISGIEDEKSIVTIKTKEDVGQ